MPEETSAPRKRVLSLIQPTSLPTIGNYFGALRNWVTRTAPGSEAAETYDCLFGVADLHALTVRPVPADLRRQTYELLAIYLALGLRQGSNVVFVQSHVPAHCQLSWILNSYTQFGEAMRMTQFKEKSTAHADNVNVGLFSYPTLMAADILIYQANYVPVGDDQKQHLELCRNIAERFNGIYGPTFPVPDPYMGKVGSRIMSLQEPTMKMSKTDPNPRGSVGLLDSPEQIAKKIKSAVTDSEACVRHAEGKEGVNNLMAIYSCSTGKDFAQIEREFAGQGYGSFKQAVAEALVEELRPFQEEYRRILADKAYLEQTAREGAQAAARIAARTLEKVMKKVGLWQVKA